MCVRECGSDREKKADLDVLISLESIPTCLQSSCTSRKPQCIFSLFRETSEFFSGRSV